MNEAEHGRPSSAAIHAQSGGKHRDCLTRLATVAVVGSTPETAVRRLRAAARSGALDGICEQLCVDLVTVFGNAARDPASARDVDIALAFAPGAQPDLLAAADALSQLTGSDELDILDLGRAGPVAREQALVGCIPLYESRPGLFAQTRMRAMLERMETDWLRRLDLEQLAR